MSKHKKKDHSSVLQDVLRSYVPWQEQVHPQNLLLVSSNNVGALELKHE